MQASLGDKLMGLSFSNLLTDLGLDPPSLVDLGEDAQEGILVNFTSFGRESNWFSYLPGW